MNEIKDLNIKIFADGADLVSIENLNMNKDISGFTTNPSLMKKAGVSIIKILPRCFENYKR